MDLKDLPPEALVEMWLPQARAVAAKARDGSEVQHFLRSKGIPDAVAGEVAAVLWQECQLKRAWWRQPKHWLGWGMIGFGLLLVVASFIHGVGVLAAIAACGFAGLGAAILWGGYLERS